MYDAQYEETAEYHATGGRRMFQAQLTYNHSIVRNIYAVQQLENGLTQFLIFDEYYRKWRWVPNTEYEPVEGAAANVD